MSLEAIEWALIQGHWPEDPAFSVGSIARDTVEGSFLPVLTSHTAKSLFTVDPLKNVLTFVVEPTPENELSRLSIGVTCLHAFIQLNWTGPDLELSPASLLTAPEPLSDESLNQKAIADLAYGGEPAYHLARSPVLLCWALQIFSQPYAHLRSAPWWRLRATITHQYVLDESAPLPPTFLAMLEPLAAHLSMHHHRDLLGRLILEQGLLHHLFSNDRIAATHFVRAARVTGLEYELTGALGKRTKFQQTELSQLVVLAESRPRADGEGDDAPPSDVLTVPIPKTLPLNDDTLLEQTEFTSSQPTASTRLAHLKPDEQPPLHPLDQCILLALCLNVKNTSPSHGLTSAQMAPYVSRVLSHPCNWSVHTMALLLRARLESTRTRTVERATLQLQALIDQMSSADAPLHVRLRFIHAMPLPSRWRLERELAQRLLALGVLRSALGIFERLELWDDVVRCWQALERPERGVAIVRDLLEGRKADRDATVQWGKHKGDMLDHARTAKLWCILGDLEPQNARAHYETAWTTSRGTSGRAMRSLGRFHFARGEYVEAVGCLQHAAKINPLQSRTWFILGCALVRLERWVEARDAFGRCVAIDDEDAESWSNLASVCLRLGKEGGAHSGGDTVDGYNDTDGSRLVPYENKLLAFRALRQGLKFSYENWRMWANYTVVATDVGELAEAARGLARVVELRTTQDGAACVDEEVVERLVDAVTHEAPPAAGEAAPAPGTLYRQVVDLFENTLRPRVSTVRISRAYARLLTWEGRWGAALAAHLEAYRAGPAGEAPRGQVEFRAGVEAVQEVVDVLRNLGPRANEGEKWRGQARGIVRGYMGKGKDFEEEEGWGVLRSLMDELRVREVG